MKKFFKMFGAAALLAGFMMLGGCGDDSSSTPTGKVVKGPVYGAKVTFAGSTSTSTTDVNGRYEIKVANAVVTSTGGTYVDVATGATKNAPNLKAEAGATAITPITTILASATATERATIVAALKLAGIDNPLNADLSTVTATNKLAISLNEIFGAALVSGDATAAVKLAVAIAPLIKSTTTTATLAADTAFIAAATTAGVSNAAAIVTAVEKLKDGSLPTPSTGSTGSTGTTK